METGTVDSDYWVTSERKEAEESASAFVNAFRRLDIDFADIEIQDPCNDCPRDEHRIAIGRISVPEAADFAWKLNRALDLLAKYRELDSSPDESAD